MEGKSCGKVLRMKGTTADAIERLMDAIEAS